jgi:hypothetical protein
MPDPGKPLDGKVRKAASHDLGALCRTTAAAWELAESGDELTADMLLEEITAMEVILNRLRQAVSRG